MVHSEHGASRCEGAAGATRLLLQARKGGGWVTEQGLGEGTGCAPVTHTLPCQSRLIMWGSAKVPEPQECSTSPLSWSSCRPHAGCRQGSPGSGAVCLQWKH